MKSKYALRFVALGYLALLLGIPVALVFVNAFQDGIAAAWDAVTTPEAQHAFYMTLVMVAVAVPLNTIFGVLAALAIVRQRFRGRALLNALIDLPFAVSPVVVGLALLLVYGSRDGWVGQWFADQGIQIIFSTPGMILATMFVSLPLLRWNAMDAPSGNQSGLRSSRAGSLVSWSCEPPSAPMLQTSKLQPGAARAVPFDGSCAGVPSARHERGDRGVLRARAGAVGGAV